MKRNLTTCIVAYNLHSTMKADSQEKEAVKLFGFWVDHKLSWEQHIAKVAYVSNF